MNPIHLCSEAINRAFNDVPWPEPASASPRFWALGIDDAGMFVARVYRDEHKMMVTVTSRTPERALSQALLAWLDKVYVEGSAPDEHTDRTAAFVRTRFTN